MLIVWTLIIKVVLVLGNAFLRWLRWSQIGFPSLDTNYEYKLSSTAIKVASPQAFVSSLIGLV